MNRSIILAVIIIGVAIILNGYLERVARAPVAQAPEKQLSVVHEKSIAVLPFEDLGSSDQNAGFADGLQQEIINRLTKIHDLKVVSPGDAMRYKAGATRNPRDIGQRLGAAKLLEGSARHEGNRVRVQVQLVDAETDRHVWAETYDREITDLFAVESEIANNVAAVLGARLSPSEKAAIADSNHP